MPRRIGRGAALGAGLTVALGAAAPAAARADVPAFTVNTTVDSLGFDDLGHCATGGSCGLREAVNAATIAGARITVPAGTYDLSGVQLAIGSTTGPVTIDGAGPGRTVLEQPSLAVQRVAEVFDGQVAISGVTITRGHAQGTTGAPGGLDGGGLPGDEARGGGILNEGALTLTDVDVEDNAASGGSGGIGGPTSGPDGTTFGGSGGPARGGGIANDGTLTLVRATVSGNAVTGGNGGPGGGTGVFPSGGAGAGGFGGGIDNAGTRLVVTDSTIQGNSVEGGVGAISGIGNSAPSGNGSGGGIAQESGELQMAGSLLSANRALGVGGLLPGASSLARGGGLWAAASFALTRSTVIGNVAETNPSGAVATAIEGGGIAASVPGTLAADTVGYNSARTTGALPPTGTGGLGGNIFSNPGELRVSDTIVTAGVGATGAEQCSAQLAPVGPGGLEDDGGAECGLSDAAHLGLDELADNGGPTETIALAAGSPARNAGTCADPTGGSVDTDQRGAPRPAPGRGCDDGAYEATPPLATAGAASDVTSGGATLHGTLAWTADATYRFSYGLADAGEHQLGALPAPVATTPGAAVSAAVGGLEAGGAYRFRLSVTGPEGTTSSEGTFTTAGGAGGGGGGGSGGGGRVALVAPKLTGLRAPKAFEVRKLRRVGRRHHRKLTGGGVMRFRLDEPATLKLRFATIAHGRKHRAKTIGTVTARGRRGANRLLLTGRVGRRTLAPGSYRLTITASTGGRAAKPVTVTIKVKRG